MGVAYRVKCNNCGNDFTANVGGGIDFYLLHCGECGKDKRVSIAEVTTKMLAGEITEEDPNKRIERVAGDCEGCSGHYRVDAPVRCPKCHSDDYSEIKEDNQVVRTHYD